MSAAAGLGSLPPNFSSAPLPVFLAPGCREQEKQRKLMFTCAHAITPRTLRVTLQNRNYAEPYENGVIRKQGQSECLINTVDMKGQTELWLTGNVQGAY